MPGSGTGASAAAAARYRWGSPQPSGAVAELRERWEEPGRGLRGPHAVWGTEGWISVTAPEPFLTLYGSVGAFQTRGCPVTSETAAQALLGPRRSVVRERGAG